MGWHFKSPADELTVQNYPSVPNNFPSIYSTKLLTCACADVLSYTLPIQISVLHILLSATAKTKNQLNINQLSCQRCSKSVGVLSQSSPPSNLYIFHVYLTSFTCDSLYYGDRLHKNLLCLYFLKKKQGFVQKVERQLYTWWWDFQKNMTWICWFGWKSGTTSDMNYGHVLFWHKRKPQFTCMHKLLPNKISPSSVLYVSCTLAVKSTYENHSKETFNFPSYQQLRDLAYVQGSKFAGDSVRDTNNLNARWYLKARLEYTQGGLTTWDNFYLDL